MHPGKMINILIKAANLMRLTQEELAALCGYSQSTVSVWHRKKKVTLHQFCDWANALGYKVILVKDDTTYTD